MEDNSELKIINSSNKSKSDKPCSVKGTGQCTKHPEKNQLVKMKRNDILKLIEKDAQDQGKVVPTEIKKLAGVDPGAKKRKIKKVSIFVGIGLAVIVLIILLATPASPLAIGGLAGIVSSMGGMSTLIPMILAGFGAIAGGAGINKRKKIQLNKGKLADHLYDMNKTDPVTYNNLEKLGQSVYNSPNPSENNILTSFLNSGNQSNGMVPILETMVNDFMIPKNNTPVVVVAKDEVKS